MEGFSSINRIVGTTPDEQKEVIIKEKELNFKEQPFPYLKSQERIKTPEEVEIILLANDATNAVRERFGLSAFEIPSDNFHIVPEEVWIKRGEKREAFYDPLMQTIVLREQSSRLASMTVMVHEMLHFKSYNALQVTTEKGKLTQYRTGLKMRSRDGKQLYFKSLDEAVIEELTKRLVTELKENTLFEDEVGKTEEIIIKYPRAKSTKGTPLFDKDTVYAEVEDKKSWGASVGRLVGLGEMFKKINTNKFTYPLEREMLDILIKKIIEKNTDQFDDTEEVFELFAKAVMTGNVLEVGKLIDTTFGIGTFRSIGQNSSIQTKIDFVKSL